MPLNESAVGALVSLLCALFAAIVTLVGWVLWLRHKLRKLEYALDCERAWWTLDKNAIVERVDDLEHELKNVLQQTGLKSLQEIKDDEAWASLEAARGSADRETTGEDREEEERPDEPPDENDDDKYGREDGFWFQTRGY